MNVRTIIQNNHDYKSRLEVAVLIIRQLKGENDKLSMDLKRVSNAEDIIYKCTDCYDYMLQSRDKINYCDTCHDVICQNCYKYCDQCQKGWCQWCLDTTLLDCQSCDAFRAELRDRECSINNSP